MGWGKSLKGITRALTVGAIAGPIGAAVYTADKYLNNGRIEGEVDRVGSRVVEEAKRAKNLIFPEYDIPDAPLSPDETLPGETDPSRAIALSQQQRSLYRKRNSRSLRIDLTNPDAPTSALYGLRIPGT